MERVNPYRADPGSHRAMRALVDHLEAGPIEPGLRTLVYLRASQINGCAFCLELHTREARAAGVAQLQLDLLAGWRDAGGFSDRERAALALTEAVTRLPADGVTDDVWRAVSRQFSDEEAASLLWLIGVINA